MNKYRAFRDWLCPKCGKTWANWIYECPDCEKMNKMNRNDALAILLLICGVTVFLLFAALISGCSAEQGRVIGTEMGEGIGRFATGYAETYQSIPQYYPEHGFRTVFVNGQPVFVNY